MQQTLPLHWSGQFTSVFDLLAEVFTKRMGGGPLSALDAMAVGAWLDALPVPVPAKTADPALASVGQQLFNSPAVGCVSCHSGTHYTNNQTMDVGTGVKVQTPSLIGVAARLPVMHDGCAKTLYDRFGPCGGTKHGNTTELSAGDITALVAFLESL